MLRSDVTELRREVFDAALKTACAPSRTRICELPGSGNGKPTGGILAAADLDELLDV